MTSVSGAYAAWISWLAAFARGEDQPTDHLNQIDERLGPEMLNRFARQLATAFEGRQRRWSDALVRDQQMLSVAPQRAAATVAVLLADARTRLVPLIELTRQPKLPEQLRTSLSNALEQTVRSAQQSLEDSAREAPIELGSAIRGNSLLPALTKATPPVHAAGGFAAPSRRVILR